MSFSEDVNSFGAYVRSIRRAAQLANPSPRLRRIVLGRNEEEEVTESHRHIPDNEAEEEEQDGAQSNEQTPLLETGPNPHQRQHSHNQNASAAQSEFAPIRSKLDTIAFSRVEAMQQQRDETRALMKNSNGEEREPLLITKIQRDDGTEAEVIIGQSTLPQTIFNSCNVLIGVGLLSLPLGIRYAGWVIGMLAIFLSAIVTKYTAGLLAKCLDVDSSLANFGDIAYVAFGEKGRILTSTLITLELLLTCVGLIILFADTLQSLIDGYSPIVWKCICGVVLAPLNFLPLRWLGYTSFLGIFCSIAIIIITALVLGAMKEHPPGSLKDVAVTTAWPENWRLLPLAFPLILALWTGHSVFPNIYRDMRHPHRYASGLRWVFGFVTSLDIVMGVVGYLLYGKEAKDEITTNMLMTEKYPWAAKLVVLVLIAIIPITKFPLQCAPIISTLEVFTLIEPRVKLLCPNRFNQSRFLTHLLRTAFRLLVPVVTVLIAIAIPSFELISALMGGLFGYLICVIIPVGLHLKMFKGQIGRRQCVIDWTLLVVSVVLGIVGTAWECLPVGWLGLE